MSKTNQRKTSFFNEGFEHGLLGYEYKWARHPMKKFYMSGYKLGKRERFNSIKRPSLIRRIIGGNG